MGHSSLRDELRRATRESHQRLDASLGLQRPDLRRPDYARFLRRMYAFHAPIERRLQRSASLRAAVPDLEGRRRAHLAASDLAALGEPIAAPAPAPALPETADLPALVGVSYVLEGATLGGAALRPLLSRRLGLEARALRYLDGYGDQTRSMWARFTASIDALELTTSERARATEAAVACFEGLLGWMRA